MSGKMFIRNRSASAGATSSPPACRPQALATAANATNAAAANETQNAAPGGSASTASGMTTAATSTARRQLVGSGLSRPCRGRIGLTATDMRPRGPRGRLLDEPGLAQDVLL